MATSANVTLSVVYTPPSAAQNTGNASMTVPITFEAQNVGVLDIPTSTPAGTVFEIPFGSISAAQLVIIKNLTPNAIGVKINGAGADIVSAPNATILSTLVALANELKADYNAHIANTNRPLHAVVDTANAVSAANASDLATAITLLNEIKADYNAHIANTGGAYHAVVDTANAVTSSNASDLPSAVVLANELKNDFNAHRTQQVHYVSDTFELETSGVWSSFQSAIPSTNPINSATVTINTPPSTTIGYVQFFVFGS